jgi:two-component system NarL family response regulator
MRVLLVDDHTILRQALRLMLGSEPDIEIVGEAGDGREAVTLTHHLQPDIVLMDIGMPVMNGIEATRAIHAESPGICVIGLSMFEHHQQARAMRAAGAMEYVTKSAPPDQLVTVMRACYQQMRRRLPPQAAA